MMTLLVVMSASQMEMVAYFQTGTDSNSYVQVTPNLQRAG